MLPWTDFFYFLIAVKTDYNLANHSSMAGGIKMFKFNQFSIITQSILFWLTEYKFKDFSCVPNLLFNPIKTDGK